MRHWIVPNRYIDFIPFSPLQTDRKPLEKRVVIGKYPIPNIWWFY